jgi:hypothetical protein
MMKEKGRKMDEWVVRHASTALSNISIKGSSESASGEKNQFREAFDSVDGIKRLFDMFEYLHTLMNHTPIEKEALQGFPFVFVVFSSQTPLLPVLVLFLCMSMK